nr:hypothetical protein CFP56_13129 [Quercus suber]
MFLDPEPRRHPSRTRSPTRISSPNRPQREQHSLERKPLQERSRSQINSADHGSASRDPSRGRKSQKPTVRLVRQSPSVPASITDSDVGVEDLKTAIEFTIRKFERAQPPLPPLTKLADTPVSKQGYGKARQPDSMPNVSRPTSLAKPPGKLVLPPSVTLLPKTSTHAVPNSAWHRRSGSSGNYSSSTTLKDMDTSLAPSGRGSERFSEGTTLRDTPTPTEQEDREQWEAIQLGIEGSSQLLEILEETSPERSTIRAVPESDRSSMADSDRPGRISASYALPPSSPNSDTDSVPMFPRESHRSRRRGLSSPSTSSVENVDFSAPGPRYRPSLQSLTESEVSWHRPSSPILVVYDTDSSTRARLVDNSPSIESIQSRLRGPASARPETGHSLVYSSSGQSLRPASSVDTLPSLRVPKKRLRRVRPTVSMASSSIEPSQRSLEAHDTAPYPRQQFSGHLSTIASEGDRTGSQHLSSFSLGSGVWTYDDASDNRASQSPSRPVSFFYASAPPSSDPQSPELRETSSEGEPGDMTLDIYRDESAKPLPLFKQQQRDVPGARGRRSPSIAPTPQRRDSDEDVDIVYELPSPVLRQQRSGYSLRKRSSSSPSRPRGVSQVSYISSDRVSIASNVFPIWAKHFYSGTIDLSSTVSLVVPSPARPRNVLPYQYPQPESLVEEHGNVSRLGTGHTNDSHGSASPPSNHFLHSIFRPQDRVRSVRDQSRHLSARWRDRRSRPSGHTQPRSRPDSMLISAAPHPLPDLPSSANFVPKTLPPGQREDEQPGDNASIRARHSSPPLQRDYSEQRPRDRMTFSHVMASDRASHRTSYDDGDLPHFPYLAPSKRNTQQPVSVFRPPSFAGSLDRLLTSRVSRQVTLFVLGFLCPLFWMLAAVLPLPPRPLTTDDIEKATATPGSLQVAIVTSTSVDTARMWFEEREWRKARWWRGLNRIMSVVGMGVIGALITLAVLATK